MSDQISVTDLVRNFASACRALTPYLDRAHVPWADHRQYDNWDRIAEALFESLVLEPCRLHVEASFPEMSLTLARYGFPADGETIFLSLNGVAYAECRFIQLLSVEEPFDHYEWTSNGSRLALPVASADISLIMIEPDGTRQEIKDIDLDL
ncbi:MAG: hypothetical protein DI527_20765 [Chelatococcus sp.]|nr:MAG: hypothetical protein DI527_20765 [Chelatococcus sp.]